MLSDPWKRERVLIVVRTYPTPATRGVEVSCTAGITESGKWVRLFPVPYRRLKQEQQFSKYQWVEMKLCKATSDPRPESHRLNLDSIKIVSTPLSTKSEWQARKDIVFALKAHCLCCLAAVRDRQGFPTLGIFKPRSIDELIIERGSDQWTKAERIKLQQASLFEDAPPEELQKIPYKFKYRFVCDHAECNGHELSCIDWEMSQSYRSWLARYGPAWEAKFRQKYEDEMIQKLDTHFYVGTMHLHPKNWIIVGLFYPPPSTTEYVRARLL